MLQEKERNLRASLKIAFGLDTNYAYINLTLHALLFIFTFGITRQSGFTGPRNILI